MNTPQTPGSGPGAIAMNGAGASACSPPDHLSGHEPGPLFEPAPDTALNCSAVTPAAQVLEVVHRPGCKPAQREKAAEMLLRAYGGKIMARCRRSGLSDEDAEEVLSDAVMKFIRLPARPEGIDKPENYFNTIVRRLILDRVEDQSRDKAVFKQPPANGGTDDSDDPSDPYEGVADEPERADPAERAAQRQLLQRIEAALNSRGNRSPEEVQQDFNLVEMHADGIPSNEIASRLGISDGAVRDRIYRIRLALRALFSQTRK